MSDKIEVSALQKALEELEASADKLNKANAVKEMPKSTKEANGGLQEHLEELPKDMQVEASEGEPKEMAKPEEPVVEKAMEKKEEKKEDDKKEDDKEEEVMKSFRDIATDSDDQFFIIDDWLKTCLDSVSKSNEEVRDALIAKGGLVYRNHQNLLNQFSPLVKAVQAIGSQVVELTQMVKSFAGEPVVGPKAQVAPVQLDRQPVRSLWNPNFDSFNKSVAPGMIPNPHQANAYAPNGGNKIDSGNILKALVDLAQSGKIQNTEVSIYETLHIDQGADCLSQETRSQLDQYFSNGGQIG